MASDPVPAAPRGALVLALRRLDGALDRLEASAMRRAEGVRAAALAGEAAGLLRQDRADLAEELDRALVRVAGLEDACAGASRRVDQAITAVRGALSRGGREAS